VATANAASTPSGARIRPKEKIVVDIVQQLTSVQRAVTGSGAERVVTLGQTYDGSLDDVWDALTSPERIPRWFLPVSGDLRAGGHFQLEGNAGGTIDRCERPTRFGATWEYGESKSRIDVTLSAVSESRTRVELAHTVAYDAERWAEFGPGDVGVGWDLTFLGFARHLSPAEDEDAAPLEQVMRVSSERWRDAGIAAGTDKAEAQEAADRTTAFYTGSWTSSSD
jgi:uncharacterized protein YndB with AHSA1/START domain